jgi:drug/metabolite transporter (DMT)-like permease
VSDVSVSKSGTLRIRATRLQVVLAFAAVYVLWGSTYLGIRFSMETLPAYTTQGVRFFLSGVLMYAWARARRVPAPTAREWGGAAITGALLFFCGSGAVIHAERVLPSGVAALLVATEPMAFVLLESMRRRRLPTKPVLAGLALGTVGLFVLVGPSSIFGTGGFDPRPALLLVASTLAWAAGSLFSRGDRLSRDPIMATAATLLTGGAFLAILGVSLGEIGAFDPSGVSAKSVLATIYLLIFGSIVGFTAYLWLLRATTASRVSTYAYVNPIVAVFLGWALANEPLNHRIYLAAAVIVGAVAMIIRHGGEELESVAPEEPDLACPDAPEKLRA